MNFFQQLLSTYRKGMDYDHLVKERDALVQECDELEEELLSTEQKLGKKDAEILLLNNVITELEEQLTELQLSETEELKTYWYNKYPKKASYSFGTVGRVKRFCKNDNDKVPVVTGRNIDEKASNALLRVIRNIRYASDVKEHWQTADETVEREAGDCEDGAILLYNIMVKSGVPSWRIRINCGDVQHPDASSKTIGHAYVTYLREEDNQWYILDWCYWPTESKSFGKKWSDSKKYFGIWFSFNEDYVWIEPQYANI